MGRAAFDTFAFDGTVKPDRKGNERMKWSIATALLLATLFFGNVVFAQAIFDASGRGIGKIDGDRIYTGSGRQIGRVDGDRIYDGSGRQIGRFDGERLYDGSGRQIVRTEGMRRKLIIVYYYFFY